MNKHARQVITQLKKLDRPPHWIEINVNTSHGYDYGHGGEPSTTVEYEIWAKNGTTISRPLSLIDGNQKESRQEGISTAKKIVEEVSRNYNPRGYEKRIFEDTNEFDTWPLTRRVYANRIVLNSKKKK